MSAQFQCRGENCGALVVWVETQAGRRMLVDADSWDGEQQFVMGKHTPHWSTCPDADQFRKTKKHNRGKGGAGGRGRRSR